MRDPIRPQTAQEGAIELTMSYLVDATTTDSLPL